MLGVLDLILLRSPAHVRDADSVVRLYYAGSQGTPQGSFSYPMLADLAGADTFSGLAAFFVSDGSVGLGPEARKVRLGLVSPGFFQLLGVQPARGRLLPEEGGAERLEPLALISWELWQRSFGGSEEILGKPLRIEGQIFTIAGVLPARFTGVDLGSVDVWLPLAALGPMGFGEGWSHNRQSFFLQAVARLRPGVTAGQAAQQATAIHRHAYLDLGDRDAGGRAILLRPIQWGRSFEGAGMARLATWLAAGAGAVLLIACANVANLLIVRGLERRGELAVRLALGASRARLARLLLSEGVLLAGMGGVAALAVAWLGGRLIRVFLLPPGTPHGSAPDFRLLGILASVALITGLLSGLGAAFWGSREEVAGAARTGAQVRRGRSRLRTALLIGQVAFTFLLLAGAALFLRSLQNVRGLALGLEPERVLVVTTNLAAAGWTPEQIDAHFRRGLERVRGLPGVERASLALGIPFRSSFGTSVTVPGRDDVYDLAPGGIYLNAVTGDFFATLGTPLLRGRALNARDDAGTEQVMVINETMARLLWPGRDPLGECILVATETGPCTTVVGVVADARRAALLREPATMKLYVPLSQAPEGMASRALFVRGPAGGERLAGAVQREMQGLAPDLPFVEVRRLSDLLEPQIRPWRLGASLFSLFASVALALAVLGIFAAVAHAVASRTDEMGLRMALGARSPHLLGLVMRSGLAPVAAGVALGLALAVWLGRFVEPLLFQVPAWDPGAASAATLALLGAALLASFLPALRVRRLDPAAAMRNE
jgi:predicted permease